MGSRVDPISRYRLRRGQASPGAKSRHATREPLRESECTPLHESPHEYMVTTSEFFWPMMSMHSGSESTSVSTCTHK